MITSPTNISTRIPTSSVKITRITTRQRTQVEETAAISVAEAVIEETATTRDETAETARAAVIAIVEAGGTAIQAVVAQTRAQ